MNDKSSLLSVMSVFNLFQLYRVLLVFFARCYDLYELVLNFKTDYMYWKRTLRNQGDFFFFVCVFWMNGIVVPPTGTFTQCLLCVTVNGG